jgi:MoxR-like ATPase
MQLPACQFNAKSSSTARDPFYTYDAIGHYRAGGGVLPFLTFNALGTAILECAVATDELRMLVPGLIPAKPRQSVVVIDEIDKAPRDFPNDLLNEIDKKYFHIPELKNVRIEASKAESPILIITSNSEKNLPGAFLRRCIYYDIPFPKPDELRLIVSRRIEEFADANGPLLTSAVNRFSSLAEDSAGMKHPPGTAELLDWMLALVRRGAKPDQDLSQQEQLVEQTFTALVKSQDDAGTAQQLLGLSSRAGN